MEYGPSTEKYYHRQTKNARVKTTADGICMSVEGMEEVKGDVADTIPPIV